MYFGYILVCLFLLQTSESKLSSLVIIHRHADRTPVVTFPYDIYSCIWTQGYGVLVEEGFQRMIDFGKILRAKYGNFWPEKHELEIESSRVDRVIKSLQFMLEGVYSDKFLIHPVSLYAREIKIDKMLFPITTDCPKYTRELTRVFKRPEHVNWFNSLQDLWTYLAEHSGEEIEKLDPNDRLQIVNLQDVFLVHRYFNLTPPDWMTNEVYDRLAQAAIEQMKIIYSTNTLQRLPAGLLFNELRKHITSVKSGNFTKVRIYSTHDVKLAAMMMGLKAFNEKLPPYGSMIIYEFHEENYIKSYYLNDTATGIFHPLKISGCDENRGCSFDHFNKLTADLVPINDNWYEDCFSSGDNRGKRQSS